MSCGESLARPTSGRRWYPWLVGLALAVSGAAGLLAQQSLPEVGQEVPDFSLQALDGDTATLSERRAEGPVVLVFFRGVW